MKLSTAIEQGLIKEGDEIEVSFMAKVDELPKDCGSIFLRINNSARTRYATEEVEVMELVNPVADQLKAVQQLTNHYQTQPVIDCNQLNPDVGKTFKLSEAKEHLKVGMRVSVWCEDFKEGKEPFIEGKIIDISSTSLNIKRDNEYSSASIQWFPRKWTVKILSDPTVKDSLPVENDISLIKLDLQSVNSRFEIQKGMIDQLYSIIKKLESLIGEPDTGIEHGDECVFERLETLESFMELHKTENAKAEGDRDNFYDYRRSQEIEIDTLDRIDELEDQVQKLKIDQKQFQELQKKEEHYRNELAIAQQQNGMLVHELFGREWKNERNNSR